MDDHLGVVSEICDRASKIEYPNDKVLNIARWKFHSAILCPNFIKNSLIKNLWRSSDQKAALKCYNLADHFFEFIINLVIHAFSTKP